MDLKLIYALILTIMPVTELRVGLPVAIIYALEHHIPIWLIFSLVILLNILIIFFIFYFLDNLHHIFMKHFKIYKKLFKKYVEKFQKRVDKFEKKYETSGMLALTLFVAVPLPGTGAWSGCLVSWLLGLERKRSILAIAIGVLIAGILILLGTLGFMKVV